MAVDDSTMTRARSWLRRLASSWRGALLLFLVACGVYALRAAAWPLKAGRDLDEYFYAWVQLFDHDVLLPWSLLFRTPVTPVVAGGSLDLLGGAATEVLVGVLFALSVVAWSAAARAFGPDAAIAVAVALLAYQGWGAMYHELSSETTFAAAFALTAWLVMRATVSPSVARFAVVGASVALLALVRPGNAVLLVLAVVPFLLPGAWRQRILWSGALALCAALPLVAWSVHNGLRFDTWSLARGGNAIVPFYRAFITDNIVSPENGEASRRLAAAMQQDLLTRDPYRSYDVTLSELFASGSFRVHEDLYILSDQVFGWSTDYEVLRRAGVEGVRAHPGTYASGVLGTVWDQLSKAFFRDLPADGASPVAAGTTVVDGRRLPEPSEGEPIPSGQVVWISRPDQSIRQVWTSPTEWHFEFDQASDRPRFARIQRETDDLFAKLPDRAGNATLALRLNQLSRWYPRPWMWIVLGVVAFAWRRPQRMIGSVALALSALVVILLNALGLFADLHFALPVAPAFVLFGFAGLLGTRAQPSGP